MNPQTRPDPHHSTITTGRHRMVRRRTALTSCAAALLALATLSPGLAAQKQPTIAQKADSYRMPARIWRDPGSMAALNLIYGAGGKTHAPNPTGTFTFVKEDPIATSPKFDVVDAQGVEWKVKLGQEPQSETAATRFLWAAGYFVDEDYYLAEFTVQGLTKLQRGQEYVSDGGVVRGARLERKVAGVTRLENWDWFDNPFVGLRELNGLRVMMSLLNNWDLKDVNNSICLVDGERRYTVTDAGATFGNTGNVITRSKSNPKDYEDSKFIAKTTPGFLDFVLHSRPLFLGAIEPGNYGERTKMESITRHIPRADAKWLGQRLSRLTDEQLRDGFRAAGYDAGDVEILARTIRVRMTALKAL
jgi:hypothetical protein